MTTRGKSRSAGVLTPIEWMEKPGMCNNNDPTNPVELEARLKLLNETRVEDLLYLLQTDE